ncbi:conserved hypothetical protein [Bradyrhizobium oligotrophicum S58]|uniref:DUF1656 domain-containing protein n=1 Tax=Bradyrhizobium oligotrophicum S58 TaxID=1245469 RepID=M4ZRZ4_9BRAD|nr:DUF1656 domain-containing protein [Bradyrhizobium oligotrophicum]BAM89005.1 conserved hypothetical protein [Bradyrhizobium oligotrophicum S58]
MRYEIDLAGVLVPSLLLWLVLAYGASRLLGAGLQRTGFYRLVWHRALFDFALFICLLGGVVYLSAELLS